MVELVEKRFSASAATRECLEATLGLGTVFSPREHQTVHARYSDAPPEMSSDLQDFAC